MGANTTDEVVVTVLNLNDPPACELAQASPDSVIQGNQVLLRAERAGNGNGRVYRVTFTASDGFGGSCTGAVSVCVPRDRGAAGCVNDGQLYDSQQP